MAENINLTATSASNKAVFALHIITAAVALTFLGLATRPTIQRLKDRRFSSSDGNRRTPLKTTLGTYLFLYPALVCFVLAYIFQFVSDILQPTGTSNHSGNLQLRARLPFTHNGCTTAVLGFAQALASISFTALINGGIWIYSNHITTNSTGTPGPSIVSRLWNTFIMLAILGTGLTTWGAALAFRASRTTTWSGAVHSGIVSRALYATYRSVVVAASLSVSVQVVRDYFFVRSNSNAKSAARPQLARFATVVVPLIWLRNAFVVYHIVLVFVPSQGWTLTTKLASMFLFIIFGQFANLTILGMILLGAWRSGKTVALFG